MATLLSIIIFVLYVLSAPALAFISCDFRRIIRIPVRAIALPGFLVLIFISQGLEGLKDIDLEYYFR